MHAIHAHAHALLPCSVTPIQRSIERSCTGYERFVFASYHITHHKSKSARCSEPALSDLSSRRTRPPFEFEIELKIFLVVLETYSHDVRDVFISWSGVLVLDRRALEV